MILVILGISIALIVVGVLLYIHLDNEVAAPILAGIGALGAFISLIIIIVLSISVTKLSIIDEKIEMYEEENAQIECQIAECVNQYQQYETKIFSEVAPESAITLIALYPELKADTLVSKQIEIYVSNNAQIKALKEQKINGSVDRWWLYFGS